MVSINYNTCALILLIKIIVCSELDCTKFITYKCFHMRTSAKLRRNMRMQASPCRLTSSALNHLPQHSLVFVRPTCSILFSLSLSHTHTRTHAHTHTHKHTHEHKHTYTHTHTLSLSLTHTHTHTTSPSRRQKNTVGTSRYLPQVGQPLPAPLERLR